MDIYMTSVLDTNDKVNGIRIAKCMNDENKFVSNLKKSIKKYDSFVLVASSPDGYEKTDLYAQLNFEGFAMSGLKFGKVTVLDNRTKNNAKEIIKNADLIILTGGIVPIQNKFFHDINLSQLLKNFHGVLIGQSAGSMNMAKTVYDYPEDLEAINNPKYLKGLGLTDLNIIPHFEPVTGNLQVDEAIDLMKILREDSKNTPLVCLPNGSYIKIRDGISEVYGETWTMKNGELKKICDNEKFVKYGCERLK